MQAVSFLYVKPPGYNAESAKAAEIADEKRKQEQALDGGSSSMYYSLLDLFVLYSMLFCEFCC